MSIPDERIAKTSQPLGFPLRAQPSGSLCKAARLIQD
jgi:hypothetical protein